MKRFQCLPLSILFLIAFFALPLQAQHKLPEDPAGLAQRAIFLYLNHPEESLDLALSGQGLIKIDPVLRIRDTIRAKSDRDWCFAVPMHADELRYPLPQTSLQLIIPDSLTGKYAYTGPEKYLGLVDEKVYLFSPLLPTKTPGLFLMERYLWGNSCLEGTCFRILWRHYLQFEIIGDQINYLDTLDQGEEADDLCAFEFQAK